MAEYRQVGRGQVAEYKQRWNSVRKQTGRQRTSGRIQTEEVGPVTEYSGEIVAEYIQTEG